MHFCIKLNFNFVFITFFYVLTLSKAILHSVQVNPKTGIKNCYFLYLVKQLAKGTVAFLD